MIRSLIVAGFLILLGIGFLLAPAGGSASAAGAHQFRHHHASPNQANSNQSKQNQAAPRRHHRHFNRHLWYPGYYGTYDYGIADAAPPPPPTAPREKAAAEPRRECEPKTYTVPAADGGESQVTVIRC